MRTIVWFSYGAASAVAWMLAKMKYDNVIAVNCDTSANEHPDNARFRRDVEHWLNDTVVTIKSEKYTTIEEVSDDTKYMAGINGARCTTELKKIPRRDFQEPDDVHVFGFTADEIKRISRFENNNPEVFTAHPLLEDGVSKQDCLDILTEAGIQIPAMYLLGFKNNNCLGCYKATSAAYWNRIRHHFPGVFERRCRDSRRLGVKLTRYKGRRIFLDELPVDYMSDVPDTEDISCGPECGQSAMMGEEK